MGLPTGLFTSIGDSRFLCRVCLDVLDEPVSLEPCDHVFCKSCIQDQPKSKCPVSYCTVNVTGRKKPNSDFLHDLNSLFLSCPLENTSSGCDWRGYLSELAAHRLDCEAKPECEYCGEELDEDEEHVCGDPASSSSSSSEESQNSDDPSPSSSHSDEGPRAPKRSRQNSD